jgi:hypothetical protein
LTSTIASRLGPAKPRGIGWEGAGALGNRLAVPAGEFLTDVLDDLPAPRLAFKGLRYHLVQLVKPLAAAFAAGTRRRLDNALHRQMVWQRPAGRPGIGGALFLSGCRRRDLGLRFLLGLGLFKVLDGQFKLLDQQPAAFRGLPVLLAPRLGQHQLQPLDFQAADGHFAGRQRQQFALRKYHRMRGGKIGRKRIGGDRHTDESIIFVAKNSARSSSSATNISSSGSLWTPGCLRHPPIDAGQKVRQLRNADRDYAVCQRWPQKAAALQPLRKQTRALAVMPNDLDQVAAAASKNVEITNMRISLQTLLHETREAREAAPHVGMTRRKPNPHVARDRDHRRSRTSSTRANASASTCASTRMRRRLPRSISISPTRATATDRARLPSSATTFTACSLVSAAAICTGAKQGPTFSTVRACRRQVNTTLAAIPLRRATSLTFAPGTSVSSTIRTLSSCDQRRRRSTPPKTSTRIA